MGDHSASSRRQAPILGERSSYGAPILFGLMLAAAAVLRGCGARGDLWLDEIWSLRMSQQVASPIGILTELHHDNNHHLNTLFLRLVGPDAPPVAYRILSLLAGLGTVGLAYRIGRRRGRVEGWIAAGMFSISFPMIVYSSEARGYALAVFFALVAYEAIDRFLSGDAKAPAVLFGASSILGLLSHPTFLYAYLAAFLWWAVRSVRIRRRPLRAIQDFASLLGVPFLAFELLYFIDLRYVGMGGGSPSSWPVVFVRSFSLVLGGPSYGPGALACGAVALSAAIASLVLMRRERSDRFVFFTTALFVAPAALRLAAPGEAVYERYFLVSLAFFLLLVAGLLARILRLGPRGKLVAIACLVLFTAGNCVHCARFFRFGRGSYVAAAQFLRDSTTDSAVTVGSDHDFRNQLVLAFAVERLGAGKPIAIYEAGSWQNAGPEWFLAHRQDPDAMPPAARHGPSGETYRLVRVFRYGGLSGWDWLVYRRE